MPRRRWGWKHSEHPLFASSRVSWGQNQSSPVPPAASAPDNGEHAWIRLQVGWMGGSAEPGASGEPELRRGGPPLSLLLRVPTPHAASFPTAPSLLPRLTQRGKASCCPIFQREKLRHSPWPPGHSCLLSSLSITHGPTAQVLLPLPCGLLISRARSPARGGGWPPVWAQTTPHTHPHQLLTLQWRRWKPGAPISPANTLRPREGRPGPRAPQRNRPEPQAPRAWRWGSTDAPPWGALLHQEGEGGQEA